MFGRASQVKNSFQTSGKPSSKKATAKLSTTINLKDLIDHTRMNIEKTMISMRNNSSYYSKTLINPKDSKLFNNSAKKQNPKHILSATKKKALNKVPKCSNKKPQTKATLNSPDNLPEFEDEMNDVLDEEEFKENRTNALKVQRMISTHDEYSSVATKLDK